MQNKPPSNQKWLESSSGFDLRTMTAKDLERIKSYYYGMISDPGYAALSAEMKSPGWPIG